jgi:predicted membrane protein
VMTSFELIGFGLSALIVAAVCYTLLTFIGRRKEREVQKFNEQRAEALAMDKEIEKLKTEVIRETFTFEEKMRAHRAKFGSPKQQPGSDSTKL